MNINVAKLRLNSICVAFYKAYSLSVVTLKSLLSMKREANIAAELILVLRFNACSRESVELCFSCKVSNRSEYSSLLVNRHTIKHKYISSRRPTSLCVVSK
jgi:hypothetical protein